MNSRNAEPATQQLFLFVNKDSKSKSLSKSEGLSAKEINRHAQQVRNRRLAVQKATTAHKSSSSARRIALGGWKKRAGEADRSPTLDTESLTPPSAVSVSSPNGAEHAPTPFTVAGSDHSSPSSSSPPDTTPVVQGNHESSTVLSSSTIANNCDVVASIEPTHATIENSARDDFNDLSIRPYFQQFAPHDQIDPFNQLPVRISSQIHLVLQHGLKIYRYSGNNYKLAYLPGHIRDNINQFPIADVVQRSIAQPHHLYAFLACLSIRMQKIFHEEIQEQAPLFFQRQASHHLRKELIRSGRNGNLDRHTILDILFLVVSETATGAHQSAREHLKVVAKLYHLLDLSKHLDHWISESCAHVDNQLALSTGNRPILPQDFDPGPLLPERRAALQRELRWLVESNMMSGHWSPSPRSLAVRAAPLGLRDAVADFSKTMDLRMGTMYERGLQLGLFTPLFASIVGDMVECVKIAKVVWLSPVAVCFDAEWLCRKARAVLRRLLMIAPEQNIGPLDVVGKCMEAVRCTLLIMMAHACTLIGSQTARHIVLKLQSSLAFALKFWAPEIGLTQELTPIEDEPINPAIKDHLGHILFTSMVGIFSADAPGYEATETFFMDRALNLCKILEIRNFIDLQDHMVQFLYSPVLQEQSLWKVADKLANMEHMRHRASV